MVNVISVPWGNEFIYGEAHFSYRSCFGTIKFFTPTEGSGTHLTTFRSNHTIPKRISTLLRLNHFRNNNAEILPFSVFARNTLDRSANTGKTLQLSGDLGWGAGENMYVSSYNWYRAVNWFISDPNKYMKLPSGMILEMPIDFARNYNTACTRSVSR